MIRGGHFCVLRHLKIWPPRYATRTSIEQAPQTSRLLGELDRGTGHIGYLVVLTGYEKGVDICIAIDDGIVADDLAVPFKVYAAVEGSRGPEYKEGACQVNIGATIPSNMSWSQVKVCIS